MLPSIWLMWFCIEGDILILELAVGQPSVSPDSIRSTLAQ